MIKRFIAILLVLCLLCGLAGCGAQPASKARFGRFATISNEEHLYYDVNTNVVYFITNFTGGYSYMSPYFADNGKPYLYENGELVEIDE